MIGLAAKMFGIAGVAGVALLIGRVLNKSAPSSVPTPPAKRLRTSTQVHNGRSYFVEDFAGDLKRVTGQAAQVLVKMTNVGPQLIAQAGQPAAIRQLFDDMGME